MKLFNKLTIGAVGVVLGLAAIPGEAKAASFDMVTNGEFEEFTIKQDKGNWKRASEVKGWETTYSTNKANEQGKFELWKQGKIGSPGKGSDGSATGYHLETNLDGIASISQTFQLGNNIDTTAIFSFDAWSRKDKNDIFGTGKVSVFGSESGSILNQAISMNGDGDISEWTQNLFELSVMAGEEITIAFTGDQKSSVSSPHIDQVAFMVKKKSFAKAVPEPASILGLLAVSALGTASTLKRKNKQEA